jgi:alpha-N-arabinofuranosidase
MAFRTEKRMHSVLRLGLFLTALLSLAPVVQAEKKAMVSFQWFEYSGSPAIGTPEPGVGEYRNPILAGFYPDPSICRVGDDFYLVNSTFTWWPGIPVFHSRDLVNWEQIGSVITRRTQADFKGIGVSRGVFAPALRFHDGLFYLVTTLVDSGDNCFFTAKDPAGPWSDPVFLREVEGIDPSFFFDDDGRAWLINNGPPPENRPLYQGHRAIWLQEFDVKTQKLVGPRSIIVNGGTDISKKPVWIEGPHIYKRNGWYYLVCAEGGTAEDHSQVVFRSKTVTGPYEPWTENPILTQRDLPAERSNSVTCSGHADFVALEDGSWWTVFLACQPYFGNLYNTGRETFLLPVTWTKDEWPRILPPATPIPIVHKKPALPAAGKAAAIPLTGTFTLRDEFDQPTLSPSWYTLRGPGQSWISLTAEAGSLSIQARPDTLGGKGVPSFLARRQQHAHCVATTSLKPPTEPKIAAGLAAFQNETHHFFFGVRKKGDGLEVFLERAATELTGPKTETIATATLPVSDSIELRINASGRNYSFAYATSEEHWQNLASDVDGSLLSTQVAGGFVGTFIGLHVRQEP